jgi:hypothetical protein
MLLAPVSKARSSYAVGGGLPKRNYEAEGHPVRVVMEDAVFNSLACGTWTHANWRRRQKEK